jgi:predicted nucleotidyltransferase
MKFGLNDNIIDILKQQISSFEEIDEAVIYGSRAMNTYRKGSDIDITFKGKNVNNSLINKLLIKIDDLYLPYRMDFSVFNHISNPDLISHINRVGKLFYKK